MTIAFIVYDVDSDYDLLSRWGHDCMLQHLREPKTMLMMAMATAATTTADAKQALLLLKKTSELFAIEEDNDLRNELTWSEAAPVQTLNTRTLNINLSSSLVTN